jgi:hypothetical protein
MHSKDREPFDVESGCAADVKFKEWPKQRRRYVTPLHYLTEEGWVSLDISHFSSEPAARRGSPGTLNGQLRGVAMVNGAWTVSKTGRGSRLYVPPRT